MKDKLCVVEVGLHPEPYWVRLTDGKIFCGEHSRQMTEYNGDTDFVLMERCEVEGCNLPKTRTGSLNATLVCPVHCSRCGHDRRKEDYLDFCSICDEVGGRCRTRTPEEVANG